MTDKSYLLDTNYLIYLVDETSSHEKRKAILLDMAEKLQAGDTEFFITPLILYEVLRGIPWQNHQKRKEIEQALLEFEILDIQKEVAVLATELYRFDYYYAQQNKQTKNLEKRKFDMFHYASAKINRLEILSQDSDITKIEQLYQQMNQSLK